MNKRAAAFLLFMAFIFASFPGCVRQDATPSDGGSSVQAAETAPAVSFDEDIPKTDRPAIDWNTAFRTDDLPSGEVDSGSIAFLKINDDGSKTVLTVPKTELANSLPKRLPRTHYYEQFMDPAVKEELLPVLDYALFRGCSSMCVPTSALSRGLIAEHERFLYPTFFDTYTFSGQGVREYEQPDGESIVFLLVSIDNYSEVRDRYRRLDGLNAANAFVDNLPEVADERTKMFIIYRWLTATVQYYGVGGASRGYFERPTWSLIFDSMIGHVAVDEGYAETLSVICNLAGIECFSVRSASHVWNVARIDGKYYRFDAACDWGSTPGDFRYFGTSDETFKAFHGSDAEEPLPFYREYCPPCGDELFPLRFDGGEDADSPENKILKYYRLRNDRNANPILLFYLMDIGYEEICKGSPTDGWVRTRVDIASMKELFGSVMTEDFARSFAEGYIEARTEGDSKLSYRLPENDPELIRLVGLSDNGDGTWTASILRFRSPFDFTEDRETVSMVLLGGEWFISGVG